MSGRWREDGTSLDISGLVADDSWLAAAAARAVAGHEVPLTVQGVVIARVVPADNGGALPAIMAGLTGDQLGGCVQ